MKKKTATRKTLNIFIFHLGRGVGLAGQTSLLVVACPTTIALLDIAGNKLSVDPLKEGKLKDMEAKDPRLVLSS